MHSAPDPVLRLQFPIIAKIICDETWLEGERRGCWVSPQDPVVVERVCAVVLRIGAQLRAQLTQQVVVSKPSVETAEAGSIDRRAA